MNACVIVVILMIISGVISVISAVLKQANAPQPVRPRPNAGGVKANANDIDKFLEEIDRLRRKKAGEAAPPARREPPVAKPVGRGRPPVARPVPTATSAPLPSRVEDLPTAVPVAISVPASEAPPPAMPSRGGAMIVPTVTVRDRPVSSSAFGRQLVSLIGSPQGLPLAIVLQEILGPPKSKR